MLEKVLGNYNKLLEMRLLEDKTNFKNQYQQ